MIISRTPFRVSLFGGGTDYPDWFREHGGAVVGLAINKYCYISVRHLPPFFEHRSRIVYSQVELVRDIEEIRHPAVRAVLGHLNQSDGLEIHHDADLPARSGLGSSSAFTVGLLNALHALERRMTQKGDLAREAIHIEQQVLQEKVGCQDQIWAAYGGLNRIEFSPDGSFSVAPLSLKPERREKLMSWLMMFFTGFSRYATDFAASQLNNLRYRKNELLALRAMVDTATGMLNDDRTPLREIGELLHESWQLKQQLADNVSNPHINEIYQAAREAGAAGGKLMGAGGGGFMVFLVAPEKRQAVRERLKSLIHVNIDIDNDGSKIVLSHPSGL